MDGHRSRYILLNNRYRYSVRRPNITRPLFPQFFPRQFPTQALRGELLAKADHGHRDLQPPRVGRIALVGIAREELRLECGEEDLFELSEEDASLLLAIPDQELRYKTFTKQIQNVWGRLSLGRAVSVLLSSGRSVPGVIRYMGELPRRIGTWFGVELMGDPKYPRQGSCDGTYGEGRRYFICEQDSGVFVNLAELVPLRGINDALISIDQRVVYSQAKGTLRYIGEERYSNSNVRTIAGLEMDEKIGMGNGRKNGFQRFVCRKDHAIFVTIDNILPLNSIDEKPSEALKNEPSGKQGPKKEVEEQIDDDGLCARSLLSHADDQADGTSIRETRRNGDSSRSLDSSDIIMAAGESSETEVETFIERQRQMLSEFKPAKLPNVGKQESREPSDNLQRQLSRTVQQLTEKTEREENLLRRLRAMEQSMTRLETQLREKESLEVSLSEQLLEKDQQIENLLTQLNEKEQRLTVVQGALWEKEALEANMQEQLERKEQQLVDSVEQLADRDQQLRNLQVQTREKNNTTAILQERLRVMVHQVDAHEEQLRTKDQEKNELERTLETVRQELRVQQAQKTPDWVIPRNQIHLTEKLRGRGGWGMVVEGKYCGCSVAVKTMYDIILSPHNRRLFEREMDIASKCRHPCLLQFIGATNEEGSPLFVTELMDKSLRNLLEQQTLSQTEISVIALDVARALNYLHQKHPTPILHRDISSANVLLWRQGEQWRAKVSDYGTAKFKQQTMTVAPGAAIYGAPEAQASNQTVKVDVYSFGVLLCEMCIRDLPDPERREQQVAMVTNSVLRALIRGCLETNAEARPSMEDIIDEIEQEGQDTTR